MSSINDNFKQILIFSVIFFLLGYLLGNNSNNSLKGVFYSDDDELTGTKKEFMIHLDADHLSEDEGHFIMKKLNSNGSLDIETDVKKIIEKSNSEEGVSVTIDSTVINGKKQIKVEVRKELKN